MKKDKNIKLLLAALLFGCLLDMPYGYYQLVRFVSMVGFALLSVRAYRKKQDTEMIIYGSLALLFQPFIKIVLGRVLWNLIDVVVGAWLLYSVYKKRK